MSSTIFIEISLQIARCLPCVFFGNADELLEWYCVLHVILVLTLSLASVVDVEGGRGMVCRRVNCVQHILVCA